MPDSYMGRNISHSLPLTNACKTPPSDLLASNPSPSYRRDAWCGAAFGLYGAFPAGPSRSANTQPIMDFSNTPSSCRAEPRMIGLVLVETAISHFLYSVLLFNNNRFVLWSSAIIYYIRRTSIVSLLQKYREHTVSTSKKRGVFFRVTWTLSLDFLIYLPITL